MNYPRRKLLKAIPSVSALAVAGCIGDDDTDPEPEDTPTPDEIDDPDTYWEDMDERLKEAEELAPDEGELMVYHNYRPMAFQQIIDDFIEYAENEYGFSPEIDFFRAAAASVASRVESERRADQLGASFTAISAPGIILDWSQRGWMHEWLPPALQDYPDDEVWPEDFMHTGTWQMPMCITIGPAIIDGDVPEPEGFAEMVFMEEMCQNMTSYDLLLGGGASWYHTSYMHKKITEGEALAGMDETPEWGEFVETFYANEPFLSPSGFSMIQQVGREEYAANMQSLFGWSALLREEDGVPVEERFPESGVPIFFNAEGLFRDAPAINTAMLFQNYWLSEGPQQKFTEIEYCFSGHENVEGIGATDLAPSFDELPAELPPWREYNEERRGILDQIRFHAEQAEPRC